MSFWIYVLKCSDGSYYTGHTDDLEKRTTEHETGAIPGCHTPNRHTVTLIFSQEFATRDEAFFSERRIKGWSR